MHVKPNTASVAAPTSRRPVSTPIPTASARTAAEMIFVIRSYDAAKSAYNDTPIVR
jgi:hypothetical protein